MKITIAQAKTLKNKLERLINDGQTPELIASAIYDALDDRNQLHLQVKSRTIRRYHEEMSAEQLVAIRSGAPAKLLKILAYIDPNPTDFKDFRDQARQFFATGSEAYKYEDIDRLVGVYDMYRPYWVEVGSPDFMRSYVRIMRRGKHYAFSEYQNWPDKGIIDISAGYLFPSRNSIIALCKSRSGRNVKFLSIAPSRYDAENFEALDRFSGSLIASSDAPPHPGHGFCCVRNPNSNRISERIPKIEMRKKVEIYLHIMLNQIHSEMDIDEFLQIKKQNTG